MSTKCIFTGKAAEFLFLTRCLIAQIPCYVPVSDEGRIDVLVGEKLIRCQVKSIQRFKRMNGLPVRKVGGTHTKIYRYSSVDVDFMIGSDLQTLDVYVVPIIEAMKYRNIISLGKMNELGYKNNLSLLFGQ